VDPRSELAAARFPAEWKKWCARTGPGASKRRQQLRKAAEDTVKIDVLRANAASCGTCANFQKKGPYGPHCELDSDFHGYALTQAANLCSRWTAKINS
jgi:hypothetical protein